MSEALKAVRLPDRNLDTDDCLANSTHAARRRRSEAPSTTFSWGLNVQPASVKTLY